MAVEGVVTVEEPKVVSVEQKDELKRAFILSVMADGLQIVINVEL
jgi:hypothetical protein